MYEYLSVNVNSRGPCKFAKPIGFRVLTLPNFTDSKILYDVRNYYYSLFNKNSMSEFKYIPYNFSENINHRLKITHNK